MPSRVPLAASLALFACAHGHPPGASPPAASPPAAARRALAWSVPPGWRTETIPFPLDFAPELRWTGLEELRFAPGMFDPEAPGYWSYAFVWWIDGRQSPPAADELAGALRVYFAGLCAAVGGKRGLALDPSRYSARLEPDPARPGGLRGSAELHDAFATGRPIRLALTVRAFPCAGASAVVVAASPAPGEAPIWRELDGLQAAFECPR